MKGVPALPIPHWEGANRGIGFVPELTASIVIAVWRCPDALENALRILTPQLADTDEVLVVSSAQTDTLMQQFPRFRHLKARPNRLVPHLWAMGMAAARNDLLAVTTAQFTPSSDWLRQIKLGFESAQIQGIAGPIDPPPNSRLTDWAIYFQRYSAYLGWNTPRACADLPADNAAYRRSALLRHPEFFDIGFWEPEFHRHLLAEGGILSWRPNMRVRQQNGYGFRRFLLQRFAHGRRFGHARAVGRGLPFRLAAAMLSPLVPLIFAVKITRRVLRHGQYLGKFFASAPWLACFLIAWAAGEMCGCLSPPTSPEPSLFNHEPPSA